jgi:nickel-dependent lactate racemase
MPAILSELSHIPRENIVFFCANGTHRQATNQELEKILGEDVVKKYRKTRNNSNERGLGARVCLLPEGPQTIPYLAENSVK